jgi:hypothetical protein
MQNAQEGEEQVIDQEYEDTTFTEDATETPESTESDETPAEDDTVTLNRADYEKLQRELAANARLRKEAKERRENGSQEKEIESKGLDRDLIDRTYLAAQSNIRDPDVQDEALRLAKKFGMSVVEAMKDDDIKTRLDNLQKKKKAQQAVAGSGGGAKSANKGMDYHVAQFKQHNIVPDDPKIAAKLMEYL